MATFSISISDEEQKLLDGEAKKNDRSRTAQVRVILKDWFERRSPEREKERRAGA